VNVQVRARLAYRPGVDLTEGVAARLAGVCVDRGGRLRTFDIWDSAARGALLVDLALAGRLVDEPDRVTVLAEPTGFGPADRVLDAMEVEAERPLPWWIDHAAVRMADVAAACVAAGRWTEGRTLLRTRYGVPRPDGPRTGDPVGAAVEVLATACGARGHRPAAVDEDALACTGDLRWICATVTEHLHQVHRRNLGAARAADGGGSPYY
jgi:Golgi phosphoprotein 3 (GPP34)